MMRRWIFPVAAAALAALIWAGPLAAAEGKDKDKKGKGANPERAFKKLDTNGDGKLTLDEFKASLKPEQAVRADRMFARMDANSDKSVSLEEFKAFREQAANRQKK
jgi:hypothetical protein